MTKSFFRSSRYLRKIIPLQYLWPYGQSSSEGLEPYNSHFSTWQLLGLADFDVEAGVLKHRGRHCYLRSATSLGTILYAVTHTVRALKATIITSGIITRNIPITAKLDDVHARPQAHAQTRPHPLAGRRAQTAWARD